MRRWLPTYHRAHTCVVSLLVLALLPTPWPKVEFHNVRHHDAAGQVCEYHDHLLRWHSSAASSEDVPILHWHWGWPASTAEDSGHSGTIPRLHAFLADEALPHPEPALVVVSDTAVRPFLPVLPPLLPPSPAFDLCLHNDQLTQPGVPPALAFSATFAPRTSLTSRLHRWSC